MGDVSYIRPQLHACIENRLLAAHLATECSCNRLCGLYVLSRFESCDKMMSYTTQGLAYVFLMITAAGQADCSCCCRLIYCRSCSRSWLPTRRLRQQRRWLQGRRERQLQQRWRWWRLQGCWWWVWESWGPGWRIWQWALQPIIWRWDVNACVCVSCSSRCPLQFEKPLQGTWQQTAAAQAHNFVNVAQRIQLLEQHDLCRGFVRVVSSAFCCAGCKTALSPSCHISKPFFLMLPGTL